MSVLSLFAHVGFPDCVGVAEIKGAVWISN
jgi:hypothetical protein